MVIQIKYDNKTAYSLMAKQYAYLYLNKACDWFNDKSGCTAKQQADTYPQDI